MKEGNTLVCLWVDNHDAAYRWAEIHAYAVHPDTRTIQIFSTEHAQVVDETGSGSTKLFGAWSHSKIRRLGVPEELIPLVRSFRTRADLDNSEGKLPDEAWLALYEVADGEDYDKVVLQIAKDEHYDYRLNGHNVGKQLVIAQDDAELKRMMDRPLDEWRIFLHPMQRRLVEMKARGPIRVLGGAGTGKTVVALHHALHLTTKVFTDPGDKILFLVFSTNLVADIRASLKKVGAPLKRIEVTNIDKWVYRQLRQRRLNWHLLV